LFIVHFSPGYQMKQAVSISLGSSKRDKATEVELLGERVVIERRGTDGDVEKATALFTELDGKVDALGVGGIELNIHAFSNVYPLRAAHRLVRNVRQTPVVDGSGLKQTLERHVADTLIAELGPAYRSGRVLLTAAIDRMGMTQSFEDHDYDITYGDLMFGLGLPIPLRSAAAFRRVAKTLLPIISYMPISVLYPTGEKQLEIIPRYTKWYGWATIIAGDCNYIKRHMPADLSGKVIVTNTTTEEDRALFRQRGVKHLLTSTPLLHGRSFGTNMMEAALTAVAAKGRTLSTAELTAMLQQLDMQPVLHTLEEEIRD
jgi:hypothetical protein